MMILAAAFAVLAAGREADAQTTCTTQEREGTVNYPAGTGTFYSPYDKACWELNCPNADDTLTIWWRSWDVVPGDTLTVNDIAITPATPLLPPTTARYVGSVVVSFTADYDAEGVGFAFDWACQAKDVASSCVEIEEFSVVKYPTSGFYRNLAQACYNLRCSAPGIEVDWLAYDVDPSDALQQYGEAVVVTGRVPEKKRLPASLVQVIFQADESGRGEGFSLTYRCVAPTATTSMTPSLTATKSISMTFSGSLTETLTPSRTITHSLSSTFSLSPTYTLSQTDTLSVSQTFSMSHTITLSLTRSATLPTLTMTPTFSMTLSESRSITGSLSYTASSSASQTLTATLPTASQSISLTDSMTIPIVRVVQVEPWQSVGFKMEGTMPRTRVQAKELARGVESTLMLAWQGKQNAPQVEVRAVCPLLNGEKVSGGMAIKHCITLAEATPGASRDAEVLQTFTGNTGLFLEVVVSTNETAVADEVAVLGSALSKAGAKEPPLYNPDFGSGYISITPKSIGRDSSQFLVKISEGGAGTIWVSTTSQFFTEPTPTATLSATLPVTDPPPGWTPIPTPRPVAPTAVNESTEPATEEPTAPEETDSPPVETAETDAPFPTFPKTGLPTFEPTVEPTWAPQPSDFFSMLDKDGSGKLSLSEALLAFGNVFSEDQVRQIFAEADVDDDGSLSPAELGASRFVRRTQEDEGGEAVPFWVLVLAGGVGGLALCWVVGFFGLRRKKKYGSLCSLVSIPGTGSSGASAADDVEEGPTLTVVTRRDSVTSLRSNNAKRALKDRVSDGRVQVKGEDDNTTDDDDDAGCDTTDTEEDKGHLSEGRIVPTAQEIDSPWSVQDIDPNEDTVAQAVSPRLLHENSGFNQSRGSSRSSARSAFEEDTSASAASGTSASPLVAGRRSYGSHLS